MSKKKLPIQNSVQRPMALTALAAKTRPETKVAARAALKAAGLKQTLVDDLLAEVTRLYAVQKKAPAARIARKLGYCPVDASAVRLQWGAPRITDRTPAHSARGSAVTLPAGTPASRLLALREKAVKTTLARMIDEHENGSWFVHLTPNPEHVGITTNHYNDKSRGKWPIKSVDTGITVPQDWRVRVQRRGLSLIDGLMTLDAAPMEAHGCELFAATWVRRTGVKNVAVDKGYIARADGVSYHGATADQALTGLAKKRRELALSIRLDAADLGDLVSKLAHVRVSVGDAKATGACEYGIKSWCSAVDLDFAAGSATLSEVYAAYQREPRPEARATLLRVLRRQRSVNTV